MTFDRGGIGGAVKRSPASLVRAASSTKRVTMSPVPGGLTFHESEV